MYRHLTQVLAAARLISRPQGATIADLEANIGISRRTVYRLLDALQELGYPIYDDKKSNTERCIKLNEERNQLKWWLPLPTVNFTFEDRVLIDFLFQKAAVKPALRESARELRRKIASLVADGGCSIAEKESGASKALITKPVLLHTAHVNKKINKEVKIHLSVLFQALSEKCVCNVSYEAISTGRIKSYKIHPLALFEHEGGLYAFVLVPYYGSIRILAVERIRSLELTEDGFIPPEDFDAEKRLSDPFGIILTKPFTARVKFSREQAPYIKERDFPDSSVERIEDGSIVLTLETGGSYELKRWVMSFGKDAELLEPISLRVEIMKDLAEVTRIYMENEV
ncbi:MAG: WYL domain-containing transcriptional regulator [Victivallales bacterium]|nr:WYL domain-containing transcriptional regulator [Victivallales bacterium]